ncbi:hypothetical protein [Frankia sp. ArI3]|uniref:hypothetical protein n=1 Tax=Frankia sp. ArI3 TaxID=1858 RepID=UPI00351D8988
MPTGQRLAHRLWPVLLTGSLLGLGALGLAIAPALAGRAPLLLIALRPTWAILLLVGGSAPFVPALLVAAFFRALVDVGYFGLARNNIRSVLLRRLGGSRLVTALARPGTQTPCCGSAWSTPTRRSTRRSARVTCRCVASCGS